jgi:hypothetical protein
VLAAFAPAFFVSSDGGSVREIREIEVLLYCLTIPLLSVAALFSWFKNVPYRVRLPVEVVVMLALLAIAAEVHRSMFYVGQAREAEKIRGLAMDLAGMTSDRHLRGQLYRISGRYARKARELEWKALWSGLTRWGNNPHYLDTADLILEIEMSETRQRIEAEMKKPGWSAGP